MKTASARRARRRAAPPTRPSHAEPACEPPPFLFLPNGFKAFSNILRCRKFETVQGAHSNQCPSSVRRWVAGRFIVGGGPIYWTFVAVTAKLRRVWILGGILCMLHWQSEWFTKGYDSILPDDGGSDVFLHQQGSKSYGPSLNYLQELCISNYTLRTPPAARIASGVSTSKSERSSIGTSMTGVPDVSIRCRAPTSPWSRNTLR